MADEQYQPRRQAGFEKYERPGIWGAIFASYLVTMATTTDRFSGTEGQRLVDRVRELEIRLATVPTIIPSNVIVAQLERIDRRLDAIEQRLARLDDVQTQ